MNAQCRLSKQTSHAGRKQGIRGPGAILEIGAGGNLEAAIHYVTTVLIERHGHLAIAATIQAYMIKAPV